MREYRYRVDREGRVFLDGSEVVDPLTLRFFVRAMTRTPDGRWLVVCQGERNWFEAEDTPLVVQRVRPAASPAPGLVLAGDHREPLDPATLERRGERLYCRVRRGTLPARFGRLALQQLAAHLAEGDGEPVLELAGARHPIPARAPSPGEDPS